MWGGLFRLHSLPAVASLHSARNLQSDGEAAPSAEEGCGVCHAESERTGKLCIGRLRSVPDSFSIGDARSCDRIVGGKRGRQSPLVSTQPPSRSRAPLDHIILFPSLLIGLV